MKQQNLNTLLLLSGEENNVKCVRGMLHFDLVNRILLEFRKGIV